MMYCLATILAYGRTDGWRMHADRVTQSVSEGDTVLESFPPPRRSDRHAGLVLGDLRILRHEIPAGFDGNVFS